MRTLLSIAAALTLFATAVPAADAAVYCPPGAMRQDDIAGLYASDLLVVEIYGCGGSVVRWENRFGYHAAGYAATDRLIGHGVLAVAYGPDSMSGGFLDSGSAVGFKAAEPGYLNVATYARPYDGWYGADDIIRIYRVQKMR